MLYRYLQKVLLLVLGFLWLPPALLAHEAWLEPVNFTVKTGDNLQAHLKVGQMMEGDTYAYYPNNFERFDITVAGVTQPLKPRFAQSPAADQPTLASGLHVLTYQSKPSTLRYKERAKFESFLKNEGIEWVLAAHKQRDLPALDFIELYKRYSKSLIKVGDGAGQDQAMGMPFEWVVETNPYATGDVNAVTAQLLFQGKPFADSYVVVFRKKDGAVEKRTYRTDTEGRVAVPVGEGGRFLINSVHMVEPTPEEVGKKQGDWLSMWASVTYEVRP